MLTDAEKVRPGFMPLVMALTEWERRYRETPERFQSEAERLAGNADSYGEGAARYLVSILEEQRGAAQSGEAWDVLR